MLDPQVAVRVAELHNLLAEVAQQALYISFPTAGTAEPTDLLPETLRALSNFHVPVALLRAELYNELRRYESQNNA